MLKPMPFVAAAVLIGDDGGLDSAQIAVRINQRISALGCATRSTDEKGFAGRLRLPLAGTSLGDEEPRDSSAYL